MVEHLPRMFKVLGVGYPELKKTILNDCQAPLLPCYSVQFSIGLITFGVFLSFLPGSLSVPSSGSAPRGLGTQLSYSCVCLAPCVPDLSRGIAESDSHIPNG